MTHLTIDNKKYVLIPEENYQELQKQAALKWKPEKTFSIEEAKAKQQKTSLSGNGLPKSNYQTISSREYCLKYPGIWNQKDY